MSNMVMKTGVVLLLVGFVLAMVGVLAIFVGYAIEDLF